MANLTLRQIKEAIESKIEAAFPGITVHKTGVLNDFSRPSFYVRLTSPKSDDQLYNRSRQMGVDIHYFPTDRYQYILEMLDTQDLLETTFGLNLAVGDRFLFLDDTTGDVVDGVLHFTFSFSFLENQPDAPPGELMQELDYNG